MNIPIIRLEIQGMKHTVQTALMEYAAKLDADIQAEVERFLTEENIRAIISETVDRQIRDCLQESVKDFFGWSGPGRRAIKEAVALEMSKRYPDPVEPS